MTLDPDLPVNIPAIINTHVTLMLDLLLILQATYEVCFLSVGASILLWLLKQSLLCLRAFYHLKKMKN